MLDGASRVHLPCHLHTFSTLLPSVSSRDCYMHACMLFLDSFTCDVSSDVYGKHHCRTKGGGPRDWVVHKGDGGAPRLNNSGLGMQEEQQAVGGGRKRAGRHGAGHQAGEAQQKAGQSVLADGSKAQD